MKLTVTLLALALASSAGAPAAHAACVTKGAVATSTDAKSAKWFALETMVQAVSWGLWPGFVATSKVDGYKITGERYSCKPDAAGVTCQGRATFCKAGG
jgi:hypothetical protein